MAKSKPKTAKKGKSGGFFAKLFDILMALIIIAIIGGAVWFWFFYEGKDSKGIGDSINDLYQGTKDKVLENTEKLTDKIDTVIDEKADEEEMEKIDGDILGEEDEMTSQYEEEMVSNYTPEKDEKKAAEPVFKADGFSKSINKWASKYAGLKEKNNADPDKDNATDNSHLICAIWKHAASENNMKFKGYIPSEKIMDNIEKIGKKEIRSGDLVVIDGSMCGMIINFKNADNYELIYVSGEKNKAVIINTETMKNYWLKPENFVGFYRLNKDILN